MPLFRVVEEYPQAVVRRTFIVQAVSAKDAKTNLHDDVVKSYDYKIDEGGEARTIYCEKIKKPTSKYVCNNCGKIWKEKDLKEIQDYYQRVEPGGQVPAGECPKCSALCYPHPDNLE
jgi:hypothetical protein